MNVPDNAVHYMEVVTRDVAAARALYESVCGWTFGPPDDALGGSIVAVLPGGGRCGIRAPLRESEEPITRTYLRVADAAKAAKAAEAKGAAIAIESMVLGPHGTISIVVFGGIEQGFWQLP